MILLTLEKYEKRALVSQDFGMSGLATETNKKKCCVLQRDYIRYEDGPKKSINSETSNGIYMSTFRGLDALRII